MDGILFTQERIAIEMKHNEIFFCLGIFYTKNLFVVFLKFFVVV